jgi:hypothetical protein
LSVEVVLQIVICQLKLVPDIDGVLGKAKQLFNAELNVEEAEVVPSRLEMLQDLLPENVLLQRSRWCVQVSLYRADNGGHSLIFSDLPRAVLHDSVEISFVQLDDLLGAIYVQEVASLQVSRILVAKCWDRLLAVLVELPVNTNCGIVRKDIQVFSQLFQKIGVLASSSSSVLLFLRHGWLNEALLLLLDISLYTGSSVSS